MKKKALVLCFFPAFTPPSSGGELRLVNLYKSLSIDFDITLLTSTDFGARLEEIAHTSSFREIRFPKDELWHNAYATLEGSGVSGDLAGLAFALAVSDPACKLTRMARTLAASADFIIHEFPYSEPIFADGSAKAKEIYNSHNFEASLLGSIVRGPGLDRNFLKLYRLEKNLTERARIVFATSEMDREKFRIFYGASGAKLRVCANGYNEGEFDDLLRERVGRGDSKSRPVLLFFGSAHQPNVEAAHFILELAGKLDNCDFVIAGGVSAAITERKMPSNVSLIGSFDQAMKIELLDRSDIFINPVVLGSGTSLKALEALGSGIPVVSTPEGARGLGLIDEIHALIVSRDNFATAIGSLIENPGKRIELQRAGSAFVREKFTWTNIAAKLARDLVAVDASANRDDAPCLISINDYPALDADSGGKARLRGLLGNLQTDVILMSFGALPDIVMLGPSFIHVTVPKTAEHVSFEAAVNEGQSLSVNDCVASLFIASNRIFAELASEIATRASAAIIEHCYAAPIVDVLTAAKPGIPLIYSAHNVEAKHRTKMLRDHAMGDVLSSLVEELEQKLVERARLIVCCTAEDALYFEPTGVETIVAVNGCVVPGSRTLEELRRIAALPSDVPRIGFMGSGHGPNVEAANFIVDRIAPYFPHAVFEFLGDVCGSIKTSLPANVHLHGRVDDRRKAAILSGWTIALNPVMSGGGSSLKLPDFMAHELATINTSSGARGFLVAERDAGVVAKRTKFKENLEKLLEDPKLLLRQRHNAYRYASDELSWVAATALYREKLCEIADHTKVAAKSLLVVTYRYTEPALGGAEEYLIEVLKRLRGRFARIDLAAIDVGHITNAHHFGCRVSDGGKGASARLGELFDRALYFPVDEPPEAEVIERSRRLERVWTRDEFSLFAPFAEHLAGPGRLRLFSGFYGPETHGGVTCRWTAPTFGILVPREARTIRMVGFASRDKGLSLTLLRLDREGGVETVTHRRQTIATWFTVNLALPVVEGEGTLVLRCDIDEHVADGDHRPFGVLLESASALLADGAADAMGRIEGLRESHADFLEDKEQLLRVDHFEAWVETLRVIALARSEAAESDFAAVRGPHSRAMQAWLAENGERYDSVLVQGIPFDVIPSTVATLRALARPPRIVTLPHFHGDDRFYHWRRYYDAFAAADATLLFSQSIADRLDMPDKIAIVPGGGVSGIEHADVGAVAKFREVYASDTPFFLVLGRKTASKGYPVILRAHELLRRRGPAPDIVMIGPDEDGVSIDRPGVHYLGRQPREVVRGALAECLGLVTMSASESFGIVLCEAWLFGKAVIANRGGYSFRELVRDGENGLLVRTEEELAEAMARISADSAKRERMGRIGFQSVQEKFTWLVTAESCYLELRKNSDI